MKPVLRFASSMLIAGLGVYAGAAFTQNYPSRPVRIVVPYVAGGGLDITARILAPKMTEAMNQPVLVENRPGASARIGQESVAKSAPDGYTILIDAPGLAIGPAIFRNLPFDPARDFIPVTQLVGSMNVLVASPKLPVNSVAELIALAKSKPGVLNHGHPGVGTSLHMAMELFKLSAGIDMVGIQYKGEPPVINALMAGEVNVAVTTFASSLPNVKARRLRVLAVTGAQRSAALPDVPTVKESGVAGLESADWRGLFVPAKTPRDAVERIHQEAVKALNLPDVRERIIGLAVDLVGSTPEEFAARFRADVAKYARIVKEARIPLLD